MTDSERIHAFLRRARSRALLETGIRIGGYSLAALVVALLVLAVLARMAGPAASWPYVAVGTLALFVAAGLGLGLFLPARALEEPTAIARMVGHRRPGLASDLVSAVELDGGKTGGAGYSLEMASAFRGVVANATDPIAVEELFPFDRAGRAVALAASASALLLVAILIFPTAIGRGMRTLFHTPTLFEGALVATDPLVGDVRVTYDFPPYTGLPRQTIEGSTGDLHALRGTRVQIEMRALRSARQARLLLGDQGEGGVLPAEVRRGKLTASLVLGESGSYRVWLLPFIGRPSREDRAHRIVVETDQPPEVDVVGPADRLELPAPRPVELAYHARDDFGLADINLVYRVNDGPEQRMLLKNAQGAREVRASTTFEPASAMLVPGAQVAYHIEARDRDDVSGSKVGVSRTLYLVIQNPRGNVEESLAREREVLEKMINVLADRIEAEASGKPDEAEMLARLRAAREAEQVTFDQAARLVEKQRHADSGRKVEATPLAAAVSRLGKVLREEHEIWSSLGKGDANAGNAAFWAREHTAAPRHIAELEGVVLALDDLIGRQRLDDLADMGKDLVAAYKRLQDLLERYKATGDEQLRRQIEREVRELREQIGELARKIAEVKARNEVSPEWINLPDTRKAVETAARLDSLLDKGDARSLGQALSDLGDSLNSLRDMLDKNANDFDSERFPQESRAQAELMRKIGDLEGDQRSLANDSRGLAKEVDGEIGRRVEAQQGEFLAKAKQKLDQIQRKLSGSVPRELGSSAETSTEAARENIRQLRRLLPAKEWSEAQRETQRMVDGLGYLQHLTNRLLGARQLSLPNVTDFDGRVDEAAGLARELAADLSRVVPKGGDVMSPEQRGRTRDLGQRQGSLEDRTRGLAREMANRDDSVPGAAQASSELEEIAGQMRQASQDLQEGSAHEGAGRADEVVERLAKMRQNMGKRSNEGTRQSREPVHIPDANSSKAPREWRQELMEAMREKAPEKFKDEVRHYYEELVR